MLIHSSISRSSGKEPEMQGSMDPSMTCKLSRGAWNRLCAMLLDTEAMQCDCYLRWLQCLPPITPYSAIILDIISISTPFIPGLKVRCLHCVISNII